MFANCDEAAVKDCEAISKRGMSTSPTSRGGGEYLRNNKLEVRIKCLPNTDIASVVNKERGLNVDSLAGMAKKPSQRTFSAKDGLRERKIGVRWRVEFGDETAGFLSAINEFRGQGVVP